jgi:hypothetical protein
VKSATIGYGHHAAQRRDVEDLTHAANVLRSAETIKVTRLVVIPAVVGPERSGSAIDRDR